MGRLKKITREQWIKALLIFLLALLSGGLVMAVDIKSSADDFENTGNLMSQGVAQRLHTTEGIVTALVDLRDTNDIGIDNPHAMATNLLKNYPYITAVAQLDRVVFSARKQYEQEQNAAGDTGYQIREYADQADNFIKARTRNTYLVTSFLSPLEPQTAQFLGVDLLLDQAVNRAFTTALEEDTPAMAIAPAFLSRQPALLMLHNTYHGRLMPKNIAERIKQIKGAVALLIDPDKMFAPLVKNHPDIDIAIRVGGVSSGEQGKLLYQHVAETGGFTLPGVTFGRQQTLQVAGQELVLDMSARYQPSLLQLLIAVLVMLLVALVLRTFQMYRIQQADASVQQEEAYRALFSERERAQVTLSSIGDAVVTTDINGSITYLNPVAEKLLGVAHDTALGKPLGKLVNILVDDVDGGEPGTKAVLDPLELALDSETELNATGMIPRLLDRGDGDNPLSVDITCSTLRDIRGQTIGSVLVMRDISQEQELKKQLTYQASHDPLTGLANRIRFESELKHAIKTCDESSLGHALCYMDLDQFKVVNDTCGHIAGDALLKQLAQVLEKRVRGSDILARLGGDEFGLLLLDCDLENAVSIADSLRMAVRQFIFRWDDRAFDIRISVGVVAIDNPRATHVELMSAADVACYIAKDAGRDSVHAYQPEDKSVTQHHDLMQWSQKIHDALRNDNFYLMLQTMTNLMPADADLQIQEFLLRIRGEDGSVVSPASFIPAAERYGLMRDIDMWVIENALKIIRDVKKETESTLTYVYSINLSGQSIGDSELADYILSKLEQNGVEASSLMLEITETAAITNFDGALDFIKRLSEAGCRFALDDFGAGLSSFGYLKRMKVDFLKIDGQFVKTMAKDPIDRMMVNNITHLAYGLGLYVIAESVEDEETLQMLRNIGVHFAQGYHIQHPTSINDWKKENQLKNIFIRTLH